MSSHRLALLVSIVLFAFVIFAMPRSGTGFLVSMLDSHPEIICHGEAFNRREIQTHHRLLRLKLFRILRNMAPRVLADYLLSRSRRNRIVGFKSSTIRRLPSTSICYATPGYER